MSKKLRNYCLGLLLLTASPLSAFGQQASGSIVPEKTKSEAHSRNGSRRINFGAKGGFTSTLALISSFSIDGATIDEVQNNYQIGYFGSLFMRINFGRHFLQPEVSYNVTRCDVAFEIPRTDDQLSGLTPIESSVTLSIHSVDVPLVYGYNFIKEGAYSLAVFGGPKIRYIWDKKSEVSFRNFDQENIREKLRPLNASFSLGVAVAISPIFFDFCYDIGLHNISKGVKYDLPEAMATDAQTSSEKGIRFHHRANVLSFSIGVFF